MLGQLKALEFSKLELSPSLILYVPWAKPGADFFYLQGFSHTSNEHLKGGHLVAFTYSAVAEHQL